MYVYSAVAPAKGEMTSLVLPSADTAMMNLFLEHVSQTFSCVLHRHASRWGGLASLRRIGGPFQHPLDHPTSLQSPRVNPVEHIWDELREKYFENRTFPSLDALIEVLCQGLNQLAHDSARLRSLTGFPHLLNIHL